MEIESSSIGEIDTEAMAESINAATEIIGEVQKDQERQTNQTAEFQQYATEQTDPRAKPGGGGFAGVAKEIQSAVVGGLQDTLHSVQTLPERTIDMVSGEMQRERKEKGYYQPEWSPFVNEENPIITKTWWGNLLRGTVHFGSMAAGITAAAGAAGISAPASLTGLAGWSLIRAAGIGAISDTISHTSDGENVLGMMRDRYGWMDTPLSTKDTDHPIWMKFKNIVEGMGIGIIFDSASMALGKGSKYIQGQVKDRTRSVNLKKLRKGLSEVRNFEDKFRAAKNDPIAGQHQGNPLSEDDPFVVWQRQKKINGGEWGAEDGSAGTVVSDITKERIARQSGISAELVEDVLRKLYSSEKFRNVVDALEGDRERLVEVFGDAVMAHQRITQGRNAADMTANEYLQEIFETSQKFDVTDIDGKKINEVTTITAKNVVVSELVVSTLLQELRDRGIAGREIANFANLLDIDGPAEQIVDTMLTAIAEAKRAKYTLSRQFAALGAKQWDQINGTVAKEIADAREQIQTILRIANEDGDGDLMLAMFEAFSSMKTVNNVEDFVSWARKMITGGEIEGKYNTGALVRELQGMMIHSVLSSPKTPMRALMGTSIATFTRPLNMALGATMMGDMGTARSGLAALNAMMESIPEAWKLFKTRLDGYWSGDISTIKSRFQEYTKGDDNWEILRRFSESNEANAGDKAAFAMANMARAANNSNFFTYSTKLMAATDDAFAYILGRAKMREKAFRSAYDAKSKGALTTYTEITPELIKVYEEDFYSQIFDANGNIIDKATQFARQEVTLTQPLTGFAKNLNSVFQQNPWAKPFFLFARTGVNGLNLTAKHTPLFNFFVKEWNEIAFANPANPKSMEVVSKYGITNALELRNAKALQVCRLAMGSSVISMAAWAWMQGKMTGNGPADRQLNQAWKDFGYKPRHIELLPGVWFGYDSIEPFNQIMSIVADIGDASQLMGEEWTERELQKISLVVAQGLTSKSYLAGMQQFVDLFGGKEGAMANIVSGLMNNQIPLASIRKDLGKVFTPYTRELNSGIVDSLRNRNLLFEHLPGEDIPIKYDILTGNPLKDWSPIVRFTQEMIGGGLFNMALDYSPGREFLFQSGYDLRASVLSSPGANPVDLSKSPKLRSKFQRAIGIQNLDAQLARLAQKPQIQESLALRAKDIADGNRGAYENRDYYHFQEIRNLFEIARYKAWESVKDDPDAIKLIDQLHKDRKRRDQKRNESLGIQPILHIYK